MKSPFKLLSGSLAAIAIVAISHVASAGTVNIDFEPVIPGTITETTRGLLGTGTVWNSVSADVPGGPGGGGPGLGLLSDLGVPTHVGVVTLPPALYFLDPVVPPYTGVNRVAQDGLVNTTIPGPFFTGGTTLTMTIGFLRPGQPYRIVYYNGVAGAIMQTVTANGVVAVCAGRTDPPPALPGVAGMDHIVLDNVIANGVGDIVITVINAAADTGTCAGLQIQGWFDGEPLDDALRADSAVAKRVASAYKGNDRYAARRTSGQTLTRRGKSARFFFRVENDGNAFGDFTVRGTGPNNTARRRYVALNPNSNVTAAVRRGNYSTRLESGESQIIRAIVRARRERRNIDTHFRSTPAGLDANDRATGRLRL